MVSEIYARKSINEENSSLFMYCIAFRRETKTKVQTSISEKYQDYSQKPQRNCTFMNSNSGLFFSVTYSAYNCVGLRKCWTQTKGLKNVVQFHYPPSPPPPPPVMRGKRGVKVLYQTFIPYKQRVLLLQRAREKQARGRLKQNQGVKCKFKWNRMEPDIEDQAKKVSLTENQDWALLYTVKKDAEFLKGSLSALHHSVTNSS